MGETYFTPTLSNGAIYFTLIARVCRVKYISPPLRLARGRGQGGWGIYPLIHLITYSPTHYVQKNGHEIYVQKKGQAEISVCLMRLVPLIYIALRN